MLLLSGGSVISLNTKLDPNHQERDIGLAFVPAPLRNEMSLLVKWQLAFHFLSFFFFPFQLVSSESASISWL